MNDTAHTPGPWALYEPSEADHEESLQIGIGDMWLIGRDNTRIALIFGGIPSEANSFLIKAAPEMYAALVALKKSSLKVCPAVANAEGRS